MPAFLAPLVALLSPRVWMIVGIVVAVGGLWGHGYYRGYSRASAYCEAQAKKAQNAADKQDLQAERDGRAQDLEITEQLTRQKKVDDATIEQLRQQIATRPAGSKCEYDKSNSDPDDVQPRRMRK